MGVGYSAFPPELQAPPLDPLLSAGPETNSPLTPFWEAKKGRPAVSPRLRPPSEPPLGAASGATGPIGTLVPAKGSSATVPAVTPAKRAGQPDLPGPSTGDFEGRPGWHTISRHPGTGMDGGVRSSADRETVVPGRRSGSTAGGGCSTTGSDGRIRDGGVPAIDAWGCGSGAMAGTLSETKKNGNGVDAPTARGYGSFSETTTSGAIRPGLDRTRSPREVYGPWRRSSAWNPCQSVLSQTTWWGRRGLAWTAHGVVAERGTVLGTFSRPGAVPSRRRLQGSKRWLASGLGS